MVVVLRPLTAQQAKELNALSDVAHLAHSHQSSGNVRPYRHQAGEHVFGKFFAGHGVQQSRDVLKLRETSSESKIQTPRFSSPANQELERN